MRRRFFIEKFNGATAAMEGEAAHHLGRVLRAQKGQLYELSDGSAAWLARIESIERDRIAFALLEPLPTPQRTLDLTLLLAVVKFDAFEWALEKATELGVATIVPIAAARSDKALLSAASKRAARWNKILLESSQQSRRLRLPILAELAKPAAAFAAQKQNFSILLSERPEPPPIREFLAAAPPATKSAALAIGPEGGWTDDELTAARAASFREASLGQLILRTETAVAVGLFVLNYALPPE